MAKLDTIVNMHTPEPSVYLDHWVWIRMARAASGNPREDNDAAILQAIRKAASQGVIFPLSATHYMETANIKDPRQRNDIARTMASISHCRTIRSQQVLFRHQFLNAMHQSFNRPTFRPSPPDTLGFGAWWAFSGAENLIKIRADDGREITDREILAWEQKIQQLTEFKILAGPGDEEVEDLRRRYNYRPEQATEITSQRLDWESTYIGLLSDDPVTRSELRVRVQAREIMHEHLRLFGELLQEYRLNLNLSLPPNSRAKMVEFADRIPSVRIAVDLKTELFRNLSTSWKAEPPSRHRRNEHRSSLLPCGCAGFRNCRLSDACQVWRAPRNKDRQEIARPACSSG
ncbi:hypothetical protein [Kitasatospora sp. LaBMicrA B282]|uniref:hypothetical protein n=1 Tax=Kitasatospora sp. LaBMicrA B282 TaxID=3420949 RepID=UPI003D0CCBFE